MEKQRFYVGNLGDKVKDDDMKSMFSKYGKVLNVQLMKDDDGKDLQIFLSTKMIFGKLFIYLIRHFNYH